MIHAYPALQFFFATSVISYVGAAIITIAFVIPLQIKQAGVHNGLRSLRRQMLMKGVLSLLVIVASVFAITAPYFIVSTVALAYLITGIVVIHAFGSLSKSVIDYMIYHHQYSAESKQMHKKIEALEIAEEKKKNKAQK